MVRQVDSCFAQVNLKYAGDALPPKEECLNFSSHDWFELDAPYEVSSQRKAGVKLLKTINHI